MRFIISVVRAYPGQSLVMALAIMLAGVAEGFSLSAILPLLGSIAGTQSGVGLDASSGSSVSDSAVVRMMKEVLETLGVPPTMEVFLFLIFFGIVLKSVLLLLAKRQIGYTVANFATDLRLMLLRALLASRWEFHLNQAAGALANAIATEAQRSCKAFLCGTLMTIAAVQAGVYVGVAFLVSWKATAIALAAGLVIFYVLKSLVAKARQAGLRQTNLLKSLLAHLTDSLHSIKPLKAMAREDRAESVLYKETTKLNKAIRKQILSKEYLNAFQEPLRTAILLVGLYAALSFMHLPLTIVMVLILLIARLLAQLGKVQVEYQRMVIFESAYWSLMAKIDEAQKDHEIRTGNLIPDLQKSIYLDQVSFAYGEKRVLKNVSLDFPAGMITAIVGPSGSGKTTIVDLVIGLLRPDQGEIRVDNQPLTQVDLRKWRKLIGYVPQESWLMHDTVLNNVTLGDPQLKVEDAELALKASGAWKFVQATPQGIHSTVGERGSKISGGQRQRISIARALVHKPKLLILDEATTALDPVTEKAICNTLRALRGDLTIIAISHQPAVMEVADKAYRLEYGTAVPVEVGLTTELQSEENSANDLGEERVVPVPGKML